MERVSFRQALRYSPLLYCVLLATQLNADKPDVPTVRLRVKTMRVRLTEGRDISFRHLPEKAGLSQTRVQQIVQDNDGFMWFATQSGLNRFDGYKCKVFKHDPRHAGSLSGVLIDSLFKDRAGTLWVGSDQALDKFDSATEAFSTIHLAGADPAKPVTFHFIDQDAAGTLWLPTTRGLYGLNNVNGRLVHYLHNDRATDSLSDTEALSTYEDRSGIFWVGTREGLDQFDRSTGKVGLHLLLDDTGLGLRMHADRFGVFWLLYGDGNLGVLDLKKNLLTRYFFEPVSGPTKTSSAVYPMLEDRDGTMWFGSNGNGLLKYDRSHDRFISYNTHPGDPESLADTRVIALFQDREGNIWEGLHQSEPNFFSPKPAPFEKFTFQPGNPNSLGSSLVSVIHEDQAGGLWLGADREIKRLDRKTGKYSTFSGIGGHEVLSIIEEGPDVLWFGTAGLGLKRYDRRTGQLKTYKNIGGDKSSLCTNFITKLLIDRNNKLWVAGWGGLCDFDLTTERFTPHHVERAGLNYEAIAEDNNGAIWLGAESGLQRLDLATHQFTDFRQTDAPDSLSDNRVNSVFVSRENTLWVGTQNGLDKFNKQTGRFTHFNQTDGLAGNIVSCMLQDNSGKLWMSTNKGVSSFDPVSKMFSNYSVADGLPGADLTGWGACSKSDSGEMFFGGFSGATAFHPDKITNDTFGAPVVLTDLRLFGAVANLGGRSPLTRSITHTNAIRLSHAQNIFSIEFSALSYSNAPTNRFRYRLEKLQEQWTEVGSDQRLASYTTLPPGDYTFRVQGATSRGPWSEPGAALNINILAPWWNAWPFMTICAAIVLIAVWYGYRYRLHQLTQKYNLRLEERVRERTRIARELHDTLLQTVQGAKIVADSVLDEPAEWNRVHLALERISDWLARATLEGRAAVSSLRGSIIETSDLVSALQQADHDCNDGSITFSTTLEGRTRDLNPLIGNEVCRIGCEAIQNACKHSNGTNVRATLTYTRNLALRVEDDGVGISNEVLSDGRADHFGLQGMRERAERMGAKLRFKSKDPGTEVELVVPGRLAYRKDRDE